MGSSNLKLSGLPGKGIYTEPPPRPQKDILCSLVLFTVSWAVSTASTSVPIPGAAQRKQVELGTGRAGQEILERKAVPGGEARNHQEGREGAGRAEASLLRLPSPLRSSCFCPLTISDSWSLLFVDLEMKGLDQMFTKVPSGPGWGDLGVWPFYGCISRTVPRLYTDFRGS